MPARKQAVNGGPDGWAPVIPDLASATGCDDWGESRPPLVRRGCRIQFLRSPSFRLPEVALKTYLGENAALDHARTLFEKSQSFHRESTPECTVPEHLLFVHRENTLVMEYVDAPVAGDLLIHGFHSPRSRRRIIRQAARWLRWFHSRSPMETAHPNPGFMFRIVDRMHGEIRHQSPEVLAEDDFLGDCIERARRYGEELRDTSLLHAVLHGDFTPFNLFLVNGRSIGIDYDANHRLHVHQDICRFLLYLEVYRIRPATAEEVEFCGGRRNDYETFFQAYGEDAIPSREAWLAMVFIEISRRLTSLTLQRAKGRVHALRFLEERQLRRRARRIARILG